MVAKTDPVTQLTDEELYAFHPVDCPLVPNAYYHGPGDEPPKELEDDLPLCCRRMARRYQSLLVHVAKTLNENGIGCVLWDGAMWSVYGFMRSPGQIDFVVADTHIDEAVEILCATPPAPLGNVRRCSPEENCHQHQADSWNHGEDALEHCAPHVHLHTDFGRGKPAIRLWKQSRTLWGLPPLTETPIPNAQLTRGKQAQALAPNYTIASHPQFTEYRTQRQWENREFCGRFPADLHQVVILLPERAFEAALRIHARYTTYDELRLEMIVHEWLFQLKVGNEDVVDVKRMMPQFRIMVNLALQGDITSRTLLLVLREILGEPAHHDGSMWHRREDVMFRNYSVWKLDLYDPLISIKLEGEYNPYARRRKPKNKKKSEEESQTRMKK